MSGTISQNAEEESNKSEGTRGEMVLPKRGASVPLESQTASKSARSKPADHGQPEDSTKLVLTPMEIKKAVQKETCCWQTVHPALIVIGGLEYSKKTEFLEKMLRLEHQKWLQKPPQEKPFSQHLVVSSGFLSPSTKTQCAKVDDNRIRLLYSFLSGIRRYCKMESLDLPLDFSSTYPEVLAAIPLFKNPLLKNTIQLVCNWLSRYENKQILKEDGLYDLDKMIHKELAVISLWELTINRTTLRFLECFRGHLYNLHAWLFVDLDRDIDKLHIPPEHSHAMQWRSRLHYLIRASCLAESKVEKRTTKVCQIFAIYGKEGESNLELNLKKLKEEAKNATSQYGLSDLFDFKVVPVNIGNKHEFKSQPYNLLLSYLRNLKAKEIPLSWTFLRLALFTEPTCDSSGIFMHYSDICQLAEEFQFTKKDIDDFLEYYTSYGDVLNVKLIDESSDWVILKPDEFLKNLCNLPSLNELNMHAAKYGIITPAKALVLFGKDGEKYFDVLLSAGLVSKLEVGQLTKELKALCRLPVDTQYVYYMSVIRQDRESDKNQTSKACIQLVSGLKSPAMNMQIAFTNQLKCLLEIKLSSSTLANTTCLRIDHGNLEVKIVVQADVVEIRFATLHDTEPFKDLNKVCRAILRAIKNIAEQRAKRGPCNSLDYYIRRQCSGQTETGPDEFKALNPHNYHVLKKMTSCDVCTTDVLNVHECFEIAAEEDNFTQNEYYKDSSVITCDDAYSLTKEITSKGECSFLAKVLDVPSAVDFIDDDDATWFTAFSIILNWRKHQKEADVPCASRYDLALKLLRHATDGKFKKDHHNLTQSQCESLLWKMARNLDIKLYSKFMTDIRDKSQNDRKSSPAEYREHSPVMASSHDIDKIIVK